MLTIRTKRTRRGPVPMCAFEGKATTHSQFLASDKFGVALRERTHLGHRQIIEICVVRCVAPPFVLTVGTSVGALCRCACSARRSFFVCMGEASNDNGRLDSARH